MGNLYIFAGTTEGRELAEFLAASLRRQMVLHIFTATEYGKAIITQEASKVDSSVMIRCRAGRLSAEEMVSLMKQDAPVCVIDATHPYAFEASKNIRFACERAGRPYERLLRKRTENGEDEETEKQWEERPNHEPKIVKVEAVKAAAEYLATRPGNIFLTTGSKELEYFAKPELCKRTYPRILPMEEGLRKCDRAGIPRQNIIGMQGPFSQSLNRALIQQTKAQFLVTKESGKAGGYYEKTAAAEAEKICCIIVARPNQENGLSREEIIDRLHRRYHLPFEFETASALSSELVSMKDAR